MNVTFLRSKVQRVCNSEKSLRGKYGDRMTEKIQVRLATLAQVETLAEMRLLPGRCHELTGDWAGHLALDLVHPQRLIFCPNHDPVPRTKEGSLIWELVTEVSIVVIADYH